MAAFFSIVLLSLGVNKASAESPFDYVGLTNLYNYHMERLSAQEREVSADLKFVQDAIATFDSYAQKAEKLRLAAQRCRERLASGELTTCTVISRGEHVSPEEADRRAAEYDAKARTCQKCSDEARRDENELLKRLKEIGAIRADFITWKKSNDDAISDALMSVAELALGRVAKYFANDAKSVIAFKGWITRYEKQLAKEGANVPVILTKLQDLHLKCLTAEMTAVSGKVLEKTEPIAMYGVLKNTVSAVAVDQSKVREDVKELLNDPVIQKYIEQDGAAMSLLDTFAQKGAEEVIETLSGASKLVPALGIAIFLKDSSYNGLKWWLSLKMIGIRYTLTEQSGNAVRSLHSLLERRKKEWGKCL